MKEAPPERRLLFERQVMIYLDDLLRAAIHLIGSRQDAEDAVQEAYYRAWKYFDTFDQTTNGRAWMFRILLNVIHSQMGKRAKREEVAFDSILNIEASASKVLSFDPTRRPERGEVVAASEKLSEEHRAVLWLVVIEEFSYKEAAEALGVPIGTVMSRLHRARRELRTLITRIQAHRARPSR